MNIETLVEITGEKNKSIYSSSTSKGKTSSSSSLMGGDVRKKEINSSSTSGGMTSSSSSSMGGDAGVNPDTTNKKQINPSSTMKGKTSSSSSMMRGDAGVNPETSNPPSTVKRPKAPDTVSGKIKKVEADVSENKYEQGGDNLSGIEKSEKSPHIFPHVKPPPEWGGENTSDIDKSETSPHIVPPPGWEPIPVSFDQPSERVQKQHPASVCTEGEDRGKEENLFLRQETEIAELTGRLRELERSQICTKTFPRQPSKIDITRDFMTFGKKVS